MATIKHLLHIAAPQEKVFEAISTIHGLQSWWTVQTSGDTGTGGIIAFRFGEMGPDFKVKELVPSKKLTFECVAGIPGWLATGIHFDLDQHEGKTRIRFRHEGFEKEDDMYASCSFSWARYLESLRQYCQTGKGEAFGSPGYRK